ncbi:MAG TPA: tyrosine-type recombinase/integrase, partial [Acidimicrobiia bacterium]|nr:tyrosine-type recombinase/integrase [Acidimicrobiia bacterium]
RRWRDVDLDSGVLVVCNYRVVAVGGIHEHSPKSKKGAAKTRVVPIGPATVANLKRWRTQVTKERLAAGEGWVDSGYVAVDPAGQPMHPEALSTSFNRAVRAVAPSLRLPRIHFHELRHSAAVVLWAAGTQTELIAERLGHADAGITRKVYLHVPRQLHDEAAVAADRALFGG